jgi:hypothetical protein
MAISLMARVDPRILAKDARATYVAHDPHGLWRVAAPGFVDLPPTTFEELPLADVRSIDGSISDVLDLPAGWYAYRSDSEATWTRMPMPEGIVYLLTCEVRPSPANTELDGMSGAIVNCWIKRPCQDVAVQFASEYLTESGWVILGAIDAPSPWMTFLKSQRSIFDKPRWMAKLSRFTRFLPRNQMPRLCAPGGTL